MHARQEPAPRSTAVPISVETSASVVTVSLPASVLRRNRSSAGSAPGLFPARHGELRWPCNDIDKERLQDAADASTLKRVGIAPPS
jgi:hypothetical protein